MAAALWLAACCPRWVVGGPFVRGVAYVRLVVRGAGPALGGLLAVLTSSTDMKATIGGKGANMLYMLAAAIHPRFLMTVDEGGSLLPVPVRVGQAVDVVAQAGRPKSITGELRYLARPLFPLVTRAP